MKKSNFDVWTKDEMRFFRRSQIEAYLPYTSNTEIIKMNVRLDEIRNHGFELKAYKYYEYHH